MSTKDGAESSYNLMDERRKTALSEVINFFRAIESDAKFKHKWCSQEQVSVENNLCVTEPELMESWLCELCNDHELNGEIVKASLKRKKRDGVWFYRLLKNLRPNT